MKFTFPVWRTLFLLINFLLIAFVVVAQDVPIRIEDIIAPGWFLENWELILLVISEVLAMLPGKHSGIIKIIMFLLRRLTGVPALKLKSKSK